MEGVSAAQKGGKVGSVSRFVVAVDVVLLAVVEHGLRCLVVRRDGVSPVTWALPGVTVAEGESLDDAASRALRERAGIEDVFVEQLYTFGDPGRDPSSRVISVVYFALVPAHRLPSPDTLAVVEVPWEGEAGGAVVLRSPDRGTRLRVAFDHADVVGLAVKRMRGKLDYTAIGFELLPAAFPLRSLQSIHEAIRGRALNKDSFRRRIVQSGLVEPTGARETGVTYRPAALFRFAHDGDSPQAATGRSGR